MTVGVAIADPAAGDDDARAGVEVAPYRTIQAAVDALPVSAVTSRLILNPGVYREMPVFPRGKRILVSGRGRAVIDGERARNCIAMAAPYLGAPTGTQVIFENVIFANPPPGDSVIREATGHTVNDDYGSWHFSRCPFYSDNPADLAWLFQVRDVEHFHLQLRGCTLKNLLQVSRLRGSNTFVEMNIRNSILDVTSATKPLGSTQSGTFTCSGIAVGVRDSALPYANRGTVAVSIAKEAVVSSLAHGHAAGTRVAFATTGALPAPLTPGQTYYVASPTTNSYKIATELDSNGVPRNLVSTRGGTQSGVHTATGFVNGNFSVVNTPPPYVNATFPGPDLSLDPLGVNFASYLGWAEHHGTVGAPFAAAIGEAVSDSGAFDGNGIVSGLLVDDLWRDRISGQAWISDPSVPNGADRGQLVRVIDEPTILDHFEIDRRASFPVTIALGAPAVVTWPLHNLPAGASVVLSTTSSLPGGLLGGTPYYAINPTANTFQLAEVPGGAAINASGVQSGDHTATTTYARNRLVRLGALLSPVFLIAVRPGLTADALRASIQYDADPVLLSGIESVEYAASVDYFEQVRADAAWGTIQQAVDLASMHFERRFFFQLRVWLREGLPA